MRQLYCAFVLLLLWSGTVWAQDTWVPPGAYSEPFAPRIATPSAPVDALATPTLTLDSPSSVVGASISTGSATGSTVGFNQPVAYDPGVQLASPFAESPSHAPVEGLNNAGAGSPQSGSSDLGAATFQSSYGVAQLAGRGPRGKAVRVFTNADVARLNDNSGTIRYGDKLAHLN
jgi:hypothetical protein